MCAWLPLAVVGLVLSTSASCGAERVLVSYAGLLTDKPNIDPSTLPVQPGTFTTYVVIGVTAGNDGNFSFNSSVTPTILGNIAKAQAKGIKFLAGVSGGTFLAPGGTQPNGTNPWDPGHLVNVRSKNGTVFIVDYRPYTSAAVSTLEQLVNGTGNGPQLDGVDIAYQRFPDSGALLPQLWCSVLKQLRERHPTWTLTISPNLGEEALTPYHDLYELCGDVLDWVNVGLAFTAPADQAAALRTELYNQWGRMAEKCTVGFTLDPSHPGFIDATSAQSLLSANQLVKGAAVFSSELSAPNNFTFEAQVMNTLTTSPPSSHNHGKKAPVGLIIGVVAGGIAIIALAVSVGIWQCRKSQPPPPAPAGPGAKPPPLGLEGPPLPSVRGLSSPVYRGMAGSMRVAAAVDVGDASVVVNVPGKGMSQGGDGDPKAHKVITERSAV